jgi:hypothetical protein
VTGRERPGGAHRRSHHDGERRGRRAHWLDDPRHVKRLWHAFLVVLAVTVAAELFVALHPQFAIEAIFGFNAAYGFLACAVMIAVAKLLGMVLKRPDSYYETDDER